VIVSPQPAGCKILNLIERFKQVVGQPVITHGTVVAFDVSVLLRLPRLYEVDAYAAFGGPGQGHCADVLWAVIATNDLWLPPPFNDPVERPEYRLSWQREVHLYTESFAIVIVDHIGCLPPTAGPRAAQGDSLHEC